MRQTRSQPDRTRSIARIADHSPAGEAEPVQVCITTTARTMAQSGRKAKCVQQPQEERCHKIVAACALLERFETTLEQQKESMRGFALDGNLIDRLSHRPCNQHRVEIQAQFGERSDHRHLSNRVEIPSLVEDKINVRQRLQPPPKATFRFAHALNHRAYLAVIRAEQHDDPVGLAERVSPEDDPLIAPKRHIARVLAMGARPAYLGPHYACGMAVLDSDARNTFLAEHDGWAIEGEALSRTFAFPNFAAAMGFVTSVGVLAEKAFHHPDIDIRYSKVTISLTTHDQGGLTENDTNLASQLDQLG